VAAVPPPAAIKVSRAMQSPPRTPPAETKAAAAPRATTADRPADSVAALPAASPTLAQAPEAAGPRRAPDTPAAPAASAAPLSDDAAPAPGPQTSLPSPIAAAAPPVLSARLQDFLDAYCLAYSRRDLENFTRLFTADAVEQDRPFQELLPTYRQNFERLAALDYRILLQDYAREAALSLVRLEGRFTMRYLLEGQGWQETRGSIFMELVEDGEGFRVQRLDYTKE
jgi:hypothetical protein